MADTFPDMRNTEDLDAILSRLGITIKDHPSGNQTGPEALRTGKLLTHTETGLTKYISPLFGFVSKDPREEKDVILWGVKRLLDDVRRRPRR